MQPNTGQAPINPANLLGLAYREEARKLPWQGPIWDVHTHLHDLEAARLFFEVADVFGVEEVWTMSPLEQVDAMRQAYGDRIHFIAVPNYKAPERPDTFTTDWLRRIEGFAAKGARVCKFWAAPRGRDIHPGLRLDSPYFREGMRLAKSLGMIFMTHVADPDLWFATKYNDPAHYGTKAQHYEALARALDEHTDTPWIAAHMAGDPEHLDHLQALMERHPNLYLDCSATKWMVRELSKHPREFRDFCRRNSGRILFGSDIVAESATMTFDLLASRYWALRTLLETGYQGPSPIDDPDLKLDPAHTGDPAPIMRGAKLDTATLSVLYRDTAKRLMPGEGPD